MRKLFLFVFAFLVVGALSVSAFEDDYAADFIYVYILTENNTVFSNDQPILNFYYKSPEGANATCSIYIPLLEPDFWGDNVSVMNNTNSTIQINTSFADGNYEYRIYCHDGTYADNSLARVFFINSTVIPLIIDSYVPTNLTPTYEENTTILFNMSVSGGTSPYSFEWFLDGVSQAVTQFWYWVIGYSDAGEHNVTGVVTDDDSSTLNMTWNVTVEDTFLEPSTPIIISPNGGSYDYMIPVSCSGSEAFNGDNEVLYEVTFSVDGSGFMPLYNNTFGTGFVDLAWVNYGSNVSFRCRTYDSDGIPSDYLYSGNITRAKKFELRLFNPGIVTYFLAGQMYQLGVLGDTGQESGVSIVNAYIDCNGDGLWDYYSDDTTGWAGLSNITKFQEYYTCVFPDASVNVEVGMTMYRSGGWLNSSFSGCHDVYDDYCRVVKKYMVDVL